PGQRIDLLFRLLRALDVSRFFGFFQFFAQIRKPPPVGGLGLLVEHLARVAQAANMNACLFEILIPARQTLGLAGFVLLALACDSTSKIKYVKFGRGMAQQMSEVPESFRVLQT